MVQNTAITKKTGLPSVSTIIEARQAAMFNHMARLSLDDHMLTCCTLETFTQACRRFRPGSDCAAALVTCCSNLSNIPIKEHWDAAVRHGRCALTQRHSLDT